MELNDTQFEIVEKLRKAADDLKEKAGNAEYEANEMSTSSYEIIELADCIEKGDIETAKDIASDLSYKQYDICHIDLYDLKETNEFLDGIEIEIDTAFPEEEEEEKEE